ncbi:ABC-type anion transport system duplicated permease subunit [Bradyrhizobium sp. LB11.1]
MPFAMPGLIWNAMMSMSGGWFFVVASEAITVGNTTVTLPGVGSYVALAIQQQDLPAIFYAILAMLLVIIGYDQLLFRPIVAWADKFRFEQTASGEAPTSWMLDLFRRTRALRALTLPFSAVNRTISNLHLPLPRLRPAVRTKGPPSRLIDMLWGALILSGTAYAAWTIYRYLSASLGLPDLLMVIRDGLVTLLRVVVLISLATLSWVPVGVWIGLRPKLAERIQPLAQFLAAFRPIWLFPSSSSPLSPSGSIPMSGSAR